MNGAHVPTLEEFGTLQARVAELERCLDAASGERWLSGAAQAAAHLDWPTQRVFKFVRQMPHYRVGGRLMFKAGELDGWVEEHGG